MKLDGTIIRDLNRIVNDRNVSYQHRNVIRRAVTIFINMEEPEETKTRIDPSMVACVCARTPTNECSHCDGVGFITREKHIGIMQEREECFLEIRDIKL